MLATRNDDTLPLPGGRRRLARSLATEVLPGARERRSAGPGTHGLRLYDWATIELAPAGMPPGRGQWLLIRRQITPTGTVPELAFYRCAEPATTTAAEMVRIAGVR